MKKKDYRTPSEASPEPFVCIVHPKDHPMCLAMQKGPKHLRRYLRTINNPIVWKKEEF